MGISRRLVPLSALLLVAIFYFLARRLATGQGWRDRAHGVAQGVAEHVGLGEQWDGWASRHQEDKTVVQGEPGPPSNIFAGPRNGFIPGRGSPKPPGSTYSKVMVVPKLKKENITWMDIELGNVEKKVYVVDDPTAPLHPPANKGHEAMVYLTYIIDHYENLPDIMLFMHNHRRTWHNNDVLDGDAGEMVRRLSSERVFREGYMNLRCQWFPGCPDWMHPGDTEFDIHKTEQILIAKAWAEIFPSDPVPEVLAQPCCSQFALSRELVHSIPKETFEHYRNWILTTKLKDFISGRVWEYMWQYAFTGENYWCPLERACYCDGYGICFGSKEKYDDWWKLKRERDVANGQLLKWINKAKKIKLAMDEGRVAEAQAMERPEEGRDREYQETIMRTQKEMNIRRNEAIIRGNDPRNRALESGRDWKEGDGF